MFVFPFYKKLIGTSLAGPVVRTLPSNQGVQVQFLVGELRSPDPWVGEDPLEKGMATHSSVLARAIPRTEEPSGLESMGSQRVEHDLATK